MWWIVPSSEELKFGESCWLVQGPTHFGHPVKCSFLMQSCRGVYRHCTWVNQNSMYLFQTLALLYLPILLPTHSYTLQGRRENSLKVLTWSGWFPGRTQSHSKPCSLCVYFLEFLTAFCDLWHWVAQGIKRSFHFTTMTQKPSPAHMGICLPGMLFIMLRWLSVNRACWTSDSGNWIIWVVATNRFPKTCWIKHKRSSCLP